MQDKENLPIVREEKRASELSENMSTSDHAVSKLWLKNDTEKKIAIKNMLTNGSLSFDGLKNLYLALKNYSVGLAMIGSLPDINIVSKKDRFAIQKFLEIIATEQYNDEPLLKNIRSIQNIPEKHPKEWDDLKADHFYPGNGEFEEIMEDIYLDIFIQMKVAAIRKLSEFGNEAENFIVALLIKQIDNRGLRENIFIPSSLKTKKLYEKTGWKWFDSKNNPEIDARGNLIKEADKQDEYYPLYKEGFRALSRIGSRESIDFTLNFLAERRFATLYLEKELVEILKIDSEYSSDRILDLMQGDILQEKHTFRIITILTDLVGAENTRKLLQKNNLAEKNINVAHAYSLITPCSDKTAITNLQKFYQENIRFEEYEVNKKMNEKEVSLLKSLMRKDQKILEMGCGTGRLISEMHKAGYDISGFDFTERHVDIVKENNPDLEVFQADWHDTKLPAESKDVIYSLGRNTSHDYSFIDQVATFREANRLLKPGGKFIFDTANREKGSYKTMVDGYAEEMKKRSIKNFRYGSIYDSPDGENFATRYAYSREDIIMLAQLTGFEIKLTKSEPLETGGDDENLYYVLEKR